MNFRKSIVFKYLRAFLLIIVVPILFLSFIINSFYTNVLLSNASNQISETLNQISTSISSEMKRETIVASNIALNDNIIGLVNEWKNSDNEGEAFYLSQQIDERIGRLFFFITGCETIGFFFDDHETAYHYRKVAYEGVNELINEDWYINSHKNPGKTLPVNSFEATVNTGQEYAFSYVHTTDSLDYSNEVDTIYFSFKTDLLQELLTDKASENFEDIVIVDHNNRIMISKNKALIGSIIGETDFYTNLDIQNGSIFSTDEEKYLVSAKGINKTDWTIVGFTNYRMLTKNVNEVTIYVFLVVGFLFLMFFIFIIFFFRNIVKPIRILTNSMEKVQDGDFQTKVSLDSEDEISHLGKSFNHMTDELNRVMIERDNEEKEKIEAEIEALQSQITPHFITNTLNSIKIMARISGETNIFQMTDAFMKLLSTSFGKTGLLNSVAEEIHNIESYVYIMKIRYGETFEVKYEVDEEILEHQVLRLILQPILENSILHGFSEMEKIGVILVKGEKVYDTLVFEIRDNGAGISSKRLSEIFSEESHVHKGFRSIGLANINKRIKLNYGQNFGLTIESQLGEYTVVRMKLPANLGKEDHHV